ncbi:hypothetical protein KY285_000658 [Solanum tuberosum]|nr:hypothetical protein KY285_000658 [Solanum tuberosum]
MKVGSPATSVCHWVGVTCGSHHQRVRSLNISSMALMGKIRPHIGNITFLDSLDLSHNYFYGNLPQEIAHLRRLRFLNLGVNGFNGEGVREEIGKLENVKELKIEDNTLSGNLPPDTCDRQSMLEELHLSFNELHGCMPLSLPNCSKLQLLYLSMHKFDGPIHSEIGYLRTIPQDIGILDNLEVLGLEKSHLTGSISISIFNISSMQTMSLEMNNLMGSLPREMGNLNKMRILYLGYNMLTRMDNPNPHIQYILVGGVVFGREPPHWILDRGSCQLDQIAESKS